MEKAIQRVEGPDEWNERRKSDRVDLLVRVTYQSVDELFSEFARNINEGGVFIETDSPMDVGSTVALEFNLPGSEEAVQTIGRVVRVSMGDGGSTPGMGIEFDELTEDDRQRINALVRGLRARTRSS